MRLIESIYAMILHNMFRKKRKNQFMCVQYCPRIAHKIGLSYLATTARESRQHAIMRLRKKSSLVSIHRPNKKSNLP